MKFPSMGVPDAVMMIAFADDNCGSGRLNAKFQVCQNILLHKIPTGSQPISFHETIEDPPCPAYHFLLNSLHTT